MGRMVNFPICTGKYRLAPRAISNQTRTTLKKWAQIVEKAERSNLPDEEERYLHGSVLKKNWQKDRSLYEGRPTSSTQMTFSLRVGIFGKQLVPGYSIGLPGITCF